MKPWMMLSVAAIFWGLNYHLARIMVQYSGAIEAGLWRYIFGVGLLLVFSLGRFPSFAEIKRQF